MESLTVISAVGIRGEDLMLEKILKAESLISNDN